MRLICILGLLWSGFSQAESYLTIIIDDIGNNTQSGESVIALNGPVNVAIIPGTPFAKTLAEKAHQSNKEVLLHMPMSGLSKSYTTENMLQPHMARQEFEKTVADNLNAVPYVVGINNHMGSEMTQYYPQMRWLMQALYDRNMYFIDSRTTVDTQALQAAKDSGIASDRRHVFLDNDINEAAINKQFDYAVNTAHENGFAIAIGHPNTTTIKVLKKRLKTLSKEGVTLVSASHYLALRQAKH